MHLQEFAGDLVLIALWPSFKLLDCWGDLVERSLRAEEASRLGSRLASNCARTSCPSTSRSAAHRSRQCSPPP